MAKITKELNLIVSEKDNINKEIIELDKEINEITETIIDLFKDLPNSKNDLYRHSLRSRKNS